MKVSKLLLEDDTTQQITVTQGVNTPGASSGFSEADPFAFDEVEEMKIESSFRLRSGPVSPRRLSTHNERTTPRGSVQTAAQWHWGTSYADQQSLSDFVGSIQKPASSSNPKERKANITPSTQPARKSLIAAFVEDVETKKRLSIAVDTDSEASHNSHDTANGIDRHISFSPSSRRGGPSSPRARIGGSPRGATPIIPVSLSEGENAVGNNEGNNVDSTPIVSPRSPRMRRVETAQNSPRLHPQNQRRVFRCKTSPLAQPPVKERRMASTLNKISKTAPIDFTPVVRDSKVQHAILASKKARMPFLDTETITADAPIFCPPKLSKLNMNYNVLGGVKNTPLKNPPGFFPEADAKDAPFSLWFENAPRGVARPPSHDTILRQTKLSLVGCLQDPPAPSSEVLVYRPLFHQMPRTMRGRSREAKRGDVVSSGSAGVSESVGVEGVVNGLEGCGEVAVQDTQPLHIAVPEPVTAITISRPKVVSPTWG